MNTKDSSILIEYTEPSGSNKGIMKSGGMILSKNIKEFTVTDNVDRVNIILIIEKSGYLFELQSEIIHPDQKRFD